MADNTQKDPKDWVSGDDPMTGAQGLVPENVERAGS
jgi:hypothetical protein